jgi:diguanylate cyclase (GGDEF)-like protein
MASVASALTWFFDEYTGTDLSLYPAVPYWNAAGMLGFFLVVTYILAELKDAMLKEKKMARTDYLTGADNVGSFTEMVNDEIRHAERYGHPFSVVYFDLDDFKNINNTLGRSTGDELLRRVVKSLKSATRKNDIVARLGGDEFAILMPEMTCEHADAAVAKMHGNLLKTMLAYNWPVTFSIGVVTFVTPPESVDALMSRVDAVMHGLKLGGKNEIRHEVVNDGKTKA